MFAIRRMVFRQIGLKAKRQKQFNKRGGEEEMFTNYIKLLIASIGVVLLSACGGGGGGGSGTSSPASVPTDPNLVFQLIPPGAFSSGYAATYQLSGSDTSGGTYTATLSNATQSQTTFNSQPAIPISQQIQITNTQTKAFVSATAIDYYSTDIGSLMLFGYVDVTYGQTKIGTTINIIPQSGKIGDFGTVGTYAGGTDGVVETITWKLTNADNGLAYLVIDTTSVKYGVLDSSEEDTYLIDQSGDRKSLTAKIYLASSGVTITLSGNKQ